MTLFSYKKFICFSLPFLVLFLNPKTGEKIAIPAKRVPTFSAGKLFKDRVQG